MVDSVLEVQNIKLPDSGGVTGADVFTSTGNVPTIASGVTFPAGHVVGFSSKNVTGVTSSVYTGISYNTVINTSNSTQMNYLTYTLNTNNPVIKAEFSGIVGFQTYSTGSPIFVLSLFNGSSFRTSIRDVLPSLGYSSMRSYPLSFVESLTQNAGTTITVGIRASLSSDFSNNTGLGGTPIVGLGSSGFDSSGYHPVYLTITEFAS